MGEKVLVTEEAKTAIKDLQQIINGGFTQQLQALDKDGQTLSDPGNWECTLARQFRTETWPQTKAALEKAKTELDELHQQLDKIANNIFHAGGNG